MISQPVEEPAAVEERPHRLREEPRFSSRRCRRLWSRHRLWRPRRPPRTQALLPLLLFLTHPRQFINLRNLHLKARLIMKTTTATFPTVPDRT